MIDTILNAARVVGAALILSGIALLWVVGMIEEAQRSDRRND